MNNSPLAFIVNPALNDILGNQTDTGFARSLGAFFGNLLNVAFGLGGVYFFFNLLRGGFEYINAGGEKEKIHQAYERIKNSLLGIVIILSAFVASNICATTLALTGSPGLLVLSCLVYAK